MKEYHYIITVQSPLGFRTREGICEVEIGQEMDQTIAAMRELELLRGEG